MLILVSCSRGKVVDHATGSFNPAKVELFKFPNTAATSPNTAWQNSYARQYYTESQASNLGGYNYGWYPGSTCGGLVSDSPLPVERWYRRAINPLQNAVSAYESFSISMFRKPLCQSVGY
jgi:hypothetical protein